MADNTVLPGTGEIIADEDIGGVKFQRVKLIKGTTGSTTPVASKDADYDTGAGTDTVPMTGIALPGAGGAVQGGTAANPIAVSATSLPLPTGGATSAAQTTAQATLAAILTGVTDTTPVATTSAAASQADGHSATIGSTADATWGGAAAATAMSIFRYIGVKLEAIRGLLAGTLTVSATTLPLPTGAASQTTLASLASTDGTLADTTWDGATPNPSKQSILRSLWTKLEAIRVAVTDATAVSIVQAQAITKGVQQALGFTVQQLKDAGRANISLLADQFRGGQIAEILVSMTTQNAYGTRSGSVTEYQVSAGKVLRMQNVTFAVFLPSTNTTLAYLKVRMRVNLAGAVTTASPIVHTWLMAGSAVANQVVNPIQYTFPEGQEFPAGARVAFTVEIPGWVNASADPQVLIDATGQEF